MHTKPIKDKIISAILRLASPVLMVILFLPNRAAAITTLPEMIGNPITVFNGLDAGTRTTVTWALGLLVLALAICVVVGVSKNTIKTSIGSNTKDAKMSTAGITDNILIALTIIVGVVVLGISFGLIMGIGKSPVV